MEVVLIIIAAMVAVAAYLYGIWLFFKYLAPALLVAGSVALTGVVLWNYWRSLGENLLWGTGVPDSPVPPEPAFKNYFFHKALLDFRQIVEMSFARNKESGRKVTRRGVSLFRGRWKWFTWPLGIIFFAVLAAAFVIAAVIFASLSAAHLLLVGSCYAIAILTAGVLWILENVVLSIRRIFLACPNCYRKFALPEYHCSCRRVHKNLVPGSYGVFRRRCACGKELPTLFFLGRDRIPAQCPNCHHDLPARIGRARSLHVPVIGGPSAGKTSYFTAALLELQRLKGLNVQFTDDRQQRAFAMAGANFLAGREPDKTRETSPTAFLAHIRTPGWIGQRERILYVYDPAGEIFQSHSAVGKQDYYAYTHGILFLIDPFSLPSVRSNFAGQIHASAQLIRPCEEDPQDVYARLINTLRSRSRQRTLSTVRFAVVITKTDAFEMAARIRGASSPSPEQAAAPPGDSIRQWLIQQGQGNLVTSVEQSFQTVGYFCCSSLGRMADGGSAAFRPSGVVEPLAWVLEGYGVRIQ